MSKFIDRLKQVSQPQAPAMGFRSTKNEAARLKIQLAVLLGDGTSDSLSAADAVIVTRVKAAFEGKPWGSWAKKGDLTEVDNAVDAGTDFMLLPSGGAAIPADRKIGKILLISPSVTDVLLRTASELPVDAIMISDEKDASIDVTWQRLMLFQRFAGLVQKPVLAVVSLSATAAELQLVWETGITGVVVEIKDNTQASALPALRERIESLTYPSRKHKERPAAALPQVVVKEDTEEVEEPDEDD